jgi:small conductance mechanosensitive channel
VTTPLFKKGVLKMEFILSIIAKVLNFLVNRTLPAVIVLVIGILAIVIVNRVVDAALKKSKLEKAAHSLIKSVVKVALFILLGLIVCSKLGLDVTSVVALASVLTLAVSLALQNALSNLIGGFTLLYTKPFHSGDFVEIAGQSGTVQEIGLTYTKLATADNKIVSIPNSAVVATQIVNYTVSGTRRVQVIVGASYDVPVENVLEALREAGNVPTALQDPAPSAALLSYKESTIEYTLFVWCKAEDYWTTLFDANKNVKAVFAEKNITMTYPHLNVHLDK